MPYGLYLSAEGAQAQSQRLEVIANNLANVDTVGFKRELAIFQARYAEAVHQGQALPGGGSLGDLSGGVRVCQTKTDFSTAALKRTDLRTDVAIPGEGFFLVCKGQETLLTRAGNFRTTATGELVTQQGYQVLSDSNAPIVITPSAGPWEITPDGTVAQGDSRQNLGLAKVASTDDLTHVGENLFRPTDKVQPLPPTERSVAPGYLEMSGVRPTTEMTALVEASRLFEANVNLLKAQDQMLGSLVNRILKA